MASAVRKNDENHLALKLRAVKKAGSLSSVRMLVKLFELQTMSEDRKMKVLLLDGQHLDILIKPKLLTSELLNTVASHFNLKEKEYFGLEFKDSLGKSHWLQPNREVLDHNFPKTAQGSLVISFCIRFYVESVSHLNDDSTVELFYLQSRQLIYEGKLECETDSVFMLAAYVLQATYGDFVDDRTAKDQLKALCVLPTGALKAFPSLPYCEEQILTVYRNLKGHTHASSIRSYMSIVERLPMYGVHYTEVKDRRGLPWWLGVSHKGISLYDYNDKRVPRRVFAWNQLENIYFRDRKFSVEVHDAKRSSSIPRRLFSLSNVNVLSWWTESTQLAKTLWTMAIAQHQFCIDYKRPKLASARSSRGISVDIPSVASKTDLRSRKPVRTHHGRSWSASFAVSDGNFVPLISSKVIERELVEALRARKTVLEEQLDEKRKSLAAICFQEATLTGQLPCDVPPEVIDLENVPRNAVNDPRQPVVQQPDEIESSLRRLEKDFLIQKRISSAYEKLVNCVVVDKQLQKSRRLLHCRALEKLKDIEAKLKYCQSQVRTFNTHQQHDCKMLTENPVERYSRQQSVSTASGSSPDLAAISTERSRSFRPWNESAVAPSVRTCAQSHGKDLPAKRHSVVDANSCKSVLPLNSLTHCHVIDSVNDMALYNLKTHQTTNYSSTDELDAFLPTLGGRTVRRWPSKHASLEGAYRRGGCAGTGLERMARNLSSGCLECQELYAERGSSIDQSPLGSILDIACEDEASGSETFLLSPAVEEPEKPTLIAKRCCGSGCCEIGQQRCSVQQQCCCGGTSQNNRRSQNCRTHGGKLLSQHYHRGDASLLVSDTVTSFPHHSRSSCESCLHGKRTGKTVGEVSRSSSCSYGRITPKSNATADVYPGTVYHDGVTRQALCRKRSHSVRGQKECGHAELSSISSSGQVFS